MFSFDFLISLAVNSRQVVGMFDPFGLCVCFSFYLVFYSADVSCVRDDEIEDGILSSAATMTNSSPVKRAAQNVASCYANSASLDDAVGENVPIRSAAFVDQDRVISMCHSSFDGFAECPEQGQHRGHARRPASLNVPSSPQMASGEMQHLQDGEGLRTTGNDSSWHSVSEYGEFCAKPLIGAEGEVINRTRINAANDAQSMERDESEDVDERVDMLEKSAQIEERDGCEPHKCLGKRHTYLILEVKQKTPVSS